MIHSGYIHFTFAVYLNLLFQKITSVLFPSKVCEDTSLSPLSLTATLDVITLFTFANLIGKNGT